MSDVTPEDMNWKTLEEIIQELRFSILIDIDEEEEMWDQAAHLALSDDIDDVKDACINLMKIAGTHRQFFGKLYECLIALHQIEDGEIEL